MPSRPPILATTLVLPLESAGSAVAEAEPGEAQPLWVTATEVLIEGLITAALAIVGITLMVLIT